LRLEIARNIDKIKSELYFYLSVKKFLTEKAKRDVPKQEILSFHSSHDLAHAPAFSLLLWTANVLAAL